MKTIALFTFFLTAVAAYAGPEVPISSTTTLSLVPATSCRVASNGASIYAVFDRFPHPFGALISANGDIDPSTTVSLPGVIADDVTSSGVSFFALTQSVEPRGLFVTRINGGSSLGTQVLIPVDAGIYPRVVASASRVFVTYEDSASAAIHVLILDHDLNVVVDDVIISGPNLYECAHASVVVGETLFLVWMNSDGGASGAKVSSIGAVSALDLPISHLASPPLLASSGNDALLVSSPASGQISAVALSVDGSVQSVTNVEAPAPVVADVAWDGRSYKLAFVVPSEDDCTGGTVLLGTLTGQTETITDQARGAALVRGDRGLFVAWKEVDCGDPERGAFYGRLVSDRPGPIVGLTYGIADQLEPSLAAGSGKTVAVWREGKRAWISHPNEPAQRLDRLELPQSSPQIASDGKSFLSVWVEENKRVVARFVTMDLELGEPFTVVDQERVDNVTLTWNGTAYTVAWNGSEAAVATIDLDASVTALLALPDTIAGSIGLSRNVIAYVEQHGNDWVVTARSSLGSPIALATITATTIGNAGMLSAWSPRIACDEESCLVTWTRRNGQGRETEAWAAFITPEGTIETPPVMVGGRSDWTNDVIAIPVFDGKNFKILVNAGLAIDEDDFTAGSLSRNRWVLYGKFAAIAATADHDVPTIAYSRALAPDTASRGFVQQLDGLPWGRRATRR